MLLRSGPPQHLRGLLPQHLRGEPIIANTMSHSTPAVYESAECPVCLGVVGNEPSFKYNGCSHVFCLICIRPWHDRPCPVCREPWAWQDDYLFVKTCIKNNVSSLVIPQEEVESSDDEFLPAPGFAIANCCERTGGESQSQPFNHRRMTWDCVACGWELKLSDARMILDSIEERPQSCNYHGRAKTLVISNGPTHEHFDIHRSPEGELVCFWACAWGDIDPERLFAGSKGFSDLAVNIVRHIPEGKEQTRITII